MTNFKRIKSPESITMEDGMNRCPLLSFRSSDIGVEYHVVLARGDNGGVSIVLGGFPCRFVQVLPPDLLRAIGEEMK